MSIKNQQSESGDADNRIDTSTARKKLELELHRALTNQQSRLLQAPTSLGKSHTVARTAWCDFPDVTGGEPVLHFHQTKTARDEAVTASEDAGVEYAVLQGRKDGCPIAAGEHDDELIAPDGSDPSDWLDRMCDVKGIEFSRAHRKLREQNDGLPCSGCEAVRQWSGIPRDEEGNPTVDVIHATAPFAHVSTLIEDANVIFDERPSFTKGFDDQQQDHFRRAFTNWLSDQTGEKLTWEGFITDVHRENENRLETYREACQTDPSEEYIFGFGESHQLASTIGRAILNAEQINCGRLVGTADRTTVVLDSQNNLSQVHRVPAFSTARCVIGLDAHPVEPLWRLNTVDDLTTRRVMSEDEQRWWRRNKRGLEVIQVGDNSNHVSSGWRTHTAKEKARRLIEEVRKKEGEAFQSCICSKAIEGEVEQFMRKAGIDSPVTMHYGNQKSRNEFEEQSVGLLLGCIDPGDDFVMDKLALCGLRAVPEQEEDGRRKAGRGFVGPDAEEAEEILASVRRDEVAQAVGRYARHPTADNSGATVYVWTDVLPDLLVDEKVSGSGRCITDKMQEIEQFVQNNSPVTTSEVVENVEASRPHVCDTLDRMQDQGVVAVEEGSGPKPNQYEYITGTLSRPVDLED